MFLEFFNNLLDRPAITGQVPDNFLEFLAALAFRRAVLDDVLVVIDLRAGGIEIKRVRG